MIGNETLNAIPLNEYKSMQFLYNIHSIICHISHNNYNHNYFHWYLKKDNVCVKYNPST